MTESTAETTQPVNGITDVHASTHAPMGPASVFLVLLSVTLWGGTAVANQFAIDVYPPIFVGGIRFGLASLFMLVWCWVAGTPIKLKGRQWWVSLVVGFLMFLQISTFNFGTANSNASHATVLVNSYVFWVAAYEFLIARTIRLNWTQALGLLMAGGGVCVLVWTADSPLTLGGLDQPTLRGDLILALSGLTLAVKILIVKWATRIVPPATLILWHDIFGTLMMFAYSGFCETHSGKALTTEALLALLYGGIVISGLCFVLNAQLLQKHGASQVSIYSFVTPLCGILLANVFRGDQLSGWLIVAGLLVAMGIYLVNSVSVRKTPVPNVVE